jgi:Xaa-Pro aminopeptidase
MVISKPQNVRYVTGGFSGSAGIAVVTASRAHLVLDFRYLEQAAAQAPGFARVHARGPLIDGVAGVLRDLEARRVGVEVDTMPVGTFQRLQAAVAPSEVIGHEGLDALRWQKTAGEIDTIRRAASIADAAFSDVLPLIRPGTQERRVAVELEYRMRARGAERSAFDIIVASGPRSAMPHGVASDRLIGPGEFVTIDFGAVVGGYASDCTRTLMMAPATDRHREIYALVLGAQQAALAGLRAGITGKDADNLARGPIAAAGHGDAFGHSLGHGVGLAIHEGPTLSPREEAVLPPGAVVSVEPGVYLPGWGGVRIEDLVVTTETGCEILTHVPKAWTEVGT